MHVEKVLEGLKKEGVVRCHYCHQELDKDKWEPCWDERHSEDYFYRSARCGACGKKNRVKMKFPGSGHDDFLKEVVEPIESTVRKVREG